MKVHFAHWVSYDRNDTGFLYVVENPLVVFSLPAP